MAQQQPPRMQNALLARLSTDEWVLLETDIQLVNLAAQATLHRANEAIEHIYFPLNGSVSLLMELSDGFSTEVVTIGREGIIGVLVALGQMTTPMVARVQVAGSAFRLSARLLVERLEQMPQLRLSILQQAGEQMMQCVQLTGCSAHHSLEARLARCLLSLADRAATRSVLLTHEAFAALLCAHRPSISVSLKRFQREGLVEQGLGSISIVDRIGLEEVACECYTALRDLTCLGRSS